jgi:hypothetical protein
VSWAWIGLGLTLAAGLLAVWSAHIPGLREWTGAAPLQPEPPADERPGGTLRAALGEPEYLDELTISHDHHGGAT